MSDPDPADAPLLSYTIGRLDRAVQQRLRGILAPYELSIPEFATLSVLRRRPGLSNAQLARRALILPQSMIQVIASLEARKLVERSPTAIHSRVLEAHLTTRGQQLVQAAERATRAFEAELASATELEQLSASMQRLLDRLQA
jgi:DNA-binding MarR family transcriptional regulator